jgi:hypothetical protein
MHSNPSTEATPGAAAGLDERLLLLSPQDNCLVAREPLAAGTLIRLESGEVSLPQNVALGHKIARGALRAGDKVLKYGASIGGLQVDVAAGHPIHTHNLVSDYTPTYLLESDRGNAAHH